MIRGLPSGYFTFVGGNLMIWKSKKQNVVARTSAKHDTRTLRGIMAKIPLTGFGLLIRLTNSIVLRQ